MDNNLETLEIQVRKFLDRCSTIKEKLSLEKIEANSVSLYGSEFAVLE